MRILKRHTNLLIMETHSELVISLSGPQEWRYIEHNCFVIYHLLQLLSSCLCNISTEDSSIKSETTHIGLLSAMFSDVQFVVGNMCIH